MKTLLNIADRYMETSDWKTMAVLKFCLFSLGLLAGLSVPKRHRLPVCLGAAAVFLATYIPLMKKLYRVCTGQEGGC